MAVASDLPALETQAEYRAAQQLGPATRRPAQERQLRRSRADRQPEPDPARARPRSRPNIKNAVIAIEDRRFYEHKGVDYQGIARALWQDMLPPARRAGRLDDHPAVREERAVRPGQPLGLPEAARGGARLPPRAQVVEGEDPHPVPEHRLLRQRRLRRRVGRAHLLRRRTPSPDGDAADCAGDRWPSTSARRGGAARRA